MQLLGFKQEQDMQQALKKILPQVLAYFKASDSRLYEYFTSRLQC